MTSSFDLESVKVIVILNSEERSDSESIVRLNSGQGEREIIGACCYEIFSLARMTNSFDLEAVKATVILNNEERGDSESIIRLCGGLGERERIGACCYEIFSLARMTNSFDLEAVKATVILNNEERV